MQSVSPRATSARIGASPLQAATGSAISQEVPVPLSPKAPADNGLLAGLSHSNRRRMLAGCEHVELAFADVLYMPGERLTHVYFPTTSFISLVMPVGDGASLEVGMVGHEGMFGVPLVLGLDTSPVHAVVQGAGYALRMAAAPFCREMRQSPSLRRRIDRYVFVHMSQLAQTAACTRFHVVEARLARWLLMTQDRARADDFHLTQQFLAFMLGVRRVGVTKAASSLQKRSLIQYSRGDVTVLACVCYDADSQVYDGVMGRFNSHSKLMATYKRHGNAGSMRPVAPTANRPLGAALMGARWFG